MVRVSSVSIRVWVGSVGLGLVVLVLWLELGLGLWFGLGEMSGRGNVQGECPTFVCRASWSHIRQDHTNVASCRFPLYCLSFTFRCLKETEKLLFRCSSVRPNCLNTPHRTV